MIQNPLTERRALNYIIDDAKNVKRENRNILFMIKYHPNIQISSIVHIEMVYFMSLLIPKLQLMLHNPKYHEVFAFISDEIKDEKKNKIIKSASEEMKIFYQQNLRMEFY